MAGEQQEALLRAFMSADAQIRAKVIPLVLQVFDRLGSWRDADIARFTSTVVPVLVGAERQMGSLTQAFVSAVVADALGVPARPITAGVTTGAGLRGVDPAEVYARPIRTVWRELAAGADLATALTRAKLRLAQIAETDLQLAKTHAARTAMVGDERVAGFRRVLTGSHSCGLCVLASTQRYHRGDLMPIHPGCDCAVAPIIGTEDPGHVIDQPLLDAAHTAIADRFGAFDASGRNPDYRDVIVTHEHGEIGPVLARRGDDFTGPSDLN